MSNKKPTEEYIIDYRNGHKKSLPRNHTPVRAFLYNLDPPIVGTWTVQDTVDLNGWEESIKEVPLLKDLLERCAQELTVWNKREDKRIMTEKKK